MPLAPITRLLVVALALRFAGDLANLLSTVWTLAVTANEHTLAYRDSWSLFVTGRWPNWFLTRLSVWALHELPQTFAYVVDIIFVEGLYRVWRNLRRVRTALEAGAVA